MGLFHAHRGALGSVAVAVAVVAVVAGSGLALARTPAGTNGMIGMPMGQPAATQGMSGTVTQLHQRVVRVTIHNFAFGPARLVVSPGTRIVWTNTDSDPHTVDGAKGLWSSEALDTGNQFAHVFAKAGTFSYYCSIHPYMHGTIVVKK